MCYSDDKPEVVYRAPPSLRTWEVCYRTIDKTEKVLVSGHFAFNETEGLTIRRFNDDQPANKTFIAGCFREFIYFREKRPVTRTVRKRK